MEEAVKVEQLDGGIALLTINRPSALNAINRDVMDALGTFFSSQQNNEALRGVIITGSGEKAFVAGADIKEFADLSVAAGSALSKKGHDVYFMIERFHVPVIAAINGFALGGGLELAMACHMRLASTNAKFGQPEVNLGLLPGYGGTQRLVQLIGKSKALEYLLTADMMNADEALRLGLVNHVTEPGEPLIEKCNEIILKISTKGPLAVKYIIECVNQYFDNQAAFDMEVEAFGKAIGSEDCKEGAAAFVEKRKAIFSGR